MSRRITTGYTGINTARREILVTVRLDFNDEPGEGRIFLEIGSHAELMARPALCAELFNLHAQGFH